MRMDVLYSLHSRFASYPERNFTRRRNARDLFLDRLAAVVAAASLFQLH